MKRYLSVTVCVCIVMLCLVPYARGADYGHVYCKSDDQTKKIALTFDDGPHPRYTEKILDILSEYNITATFFIIGVNAQNYPDSLMKIANSGCEIGNHTYSHKNAGNMSAEELKDEVQRCEDLLFEMTGKRPSLFRPPQGYLSAYTLDVTSSMNYNVILWSIDTLDWSLNPSSKIYTTVMKNLKGGDIILMHDYVSGGNTTCDALKLLIPKLLNEGYEFVTVSNLLGI